MITVTPWDVKGNIDYDKIINEFGVQKIDTILLKRIEKIAQSKGLELHPFLRRGIFFAHRDLKWILDEYDKGNEFFLYTGIGPSGPIHLGHAVPWMFTKWLQDLFDVELWFQFTDDEKFLFKNKSFAEIQEYLHENMLDVIAMGFDPKKTHFLIDTMHAHIMYKHAIQVAKKITFSTVKAAFGLGNDSNIGQIFYTSMQAVPAFLPSIIKGKNIPCLIPHAIDQDPHFRISRDVIQKLGYHKPASIQCRFLPSLGGMDDGKMSSSASQSTSIDMTDTPSQVKKKINKYAFSGGAATVEEHRERGGNPDIDVSYQWLTFFEEDDKKLQEIYTDYKSGKLLSGELKALAIAKVQEVLADHQKRRERAESQINRFIYQSKT